MISGGRLHEYGLSVGNVRRNRCISSPSKAGVLRTLESYRSQHGCRGPTKSYARACRRRKCSLYRAESLPSGPHVNVRTAGALLTGMVLPQTRQACCVGVEAHQADLTASTHADRPCASIVYHTDCTACVGSGAALNAT